MGPRYAEKQVWQQVKGGERVTSKFVPHVRTWKKVRLAGKILLASCYIGVQVCLL